MRQNQVYYDAQDFWTYVSHQCSRHPPIASVSFAPVSIVMLDILLITGDLTSMSLHKEFQLAHSKLKGNQQGMLNVFVSFQISFLRTLSVSNSTLVLPTVIATFHFLYFYFSSNLPILSHHSIFYSSDFDFLCVIECELVFVFFERI